MPAGSLPAGEAKVRFKVALLFATALPDDRAKVPSAMRGLIDRAKRMTAQSP
jgi:hypothetical protein